MKVALQELGEAVSTLQKKNSDPIHSESGNWPTEDHECEQFLLKN